MEKTASFLKQKKKNTSSTLTALVNSLCAKRKWVLDQNLSDMKEYSMSWGPAFYVVHDDLLLPGEQLVIWRRFYRGVVSRHIASQSWFSLLSWTESWGNLKAMTTAMASKTLPKKWFGLLQTSSLLLQLYKFVKCWRFLQELNSKGLYLSSLNEKKRKIVVLCLLPL